MALFDEQPLVMACDGDRMIGILTTPAAIAGLPVLIVVGGPQCRTGSHRQFTLLARALGGAGIPSLRYDYRGMGDSDGDIRTFEQVGLDLRAAVDALAERFPAQRGVVLWGLCDAASAAALYAKSDSRVAGLVLLNPWVRTTEGQARALVKHYYARRVMTADFWRKLLGGGFAWSKALDDLRSNFRLAAGAGRSASSEASAECSPDACDAAPLPARLASALDAFRGSILLVLSGNDLTAQEFRDAVAASERWQRIMSRSSIVEREIVEANHTFATRAWRDTVASWTIEWVLELSSRHGEANVSGAAARPFASSPESGSRVLRADGRVHS